MQKRGGGEGVATQCGGLGRGVAAYGSCGGGRGEGAAEGRGMAGSCGHPN